MSLKRFTAITPQGDVSVWIDPRQVLAITTPGLEAKPPLNAGTPQVFVAGGMALSLRGSVKDVLAQAPGMVRFTGLEGRGLWVNPASVKAVTLVPKGVKGVREGSPVMHTTGGLDVTVQDDIKAVVAQLGGSAIEMVAA